MNKVIKQLLDDGKITQDEYDILFEDKSSWYRIDNKEKRDWFISHEKQIQFWETIKKVKEFFENLPNDFSVLLGYDFSFIQFPEMLIHDGRIVSPNKLLSEFLDTYSRVNFYKAIFHGGIIIVNSKFLIDLDFRECKFKDTFSLNSCEIKNIDFLNAIFSNSVQITETIFLKKTKFTNSTFEKNVSFENVYFEEFFNASKMSFNKINLTGIYFEAPNLLELSGYVNNNKVPLEAKHFANKESARLIKDLFEKQNNITEANKYFVLEQEKYTEEILNDKINNSKIKKLIPLYLNKYISNFGIDWILPILVLTFFGYFAGLLYAFFQTGYEDICFRDITKIKLLFAGLGISGLFYISYLKKSFYYMWFFGLLYTFIMLASADFRQINNDISKLINPLEMFKDKNYFDNLAILGIFYKTVVATLIYQFLVAFRQNTRRS